MQNRINIPLIVAILIPIAMVLFISASIYLPTLFIKPKYNFLYSTGNNYSSPFYYRAKNGKLEKVVYENPDSYRTYNNTYPQKLFIHDIGTNKSREVDFEEAQSLSLEQSPISPDGFEVVNGSGSYGLFFFSSGNSRDTHFLKKDSYSKKLDLNTAGNYYGYEFLGWIE